MKIRLTLDLEVEADEYNVKDLLWRISQLPSAQPTPMHAPVSIILTVHPLKLHGYTYKEMVSDGRQEA